MGFVLLALGRGKTFLATELFGNACHITLVFMAIKFGALPQTAQAFGLSYLIYTFMMLVICKKLIGFHWNRAVVRLLFHSLIQFSLIALFLKTLPNWIGLSLAMVIVVMSGILSLKIIVRLLDAEHPIMSKLQKIPMLAFMMKI